MSQPAGPLVLDHICGARMLSAGTRPGPGYGWFLHEEELNSKDIRQLKRVSAGFIRASLFVLDAQVLFSPIKVMRTLTIRVTWIVQKSSVTLRSLRRLNPADRVLNTACLFRSKRLSHERARRAQLG
jgi:hypothetical protein